MVRDDDAGKSELRRGGAKGGGKLQISCLLYKLAFSPESGGHLDMRTKHKKKETLYYCEATTKLQRGR